jgi:hypothetical protein
VAKLPRYRPLGASIPSLPSVDYVGVGRAQARVAQTVAQQLDRMSSFAFREAEVQAKIEGAEFGAANAPSAEQLLTAQTEEEREALAPGGPGTVYDRAAREAALRVITTNLETAARDEIARTRAEAKSNFTPLSDLQAEIDGIINGYTGALYDISPAAAPSLRGSLSSVGNSAYVAHADTMATKAKADAEFQATVGMEGIVNNIGERIFTSAAKGADELANVILFERNKLQQLADVIDDDTKLAQYVGDFNQATDSALIGIVSDWALTNPIVNKQQWLDNKIEDPAVKNVVALMTGEQRRDAFKAIGEAESNYYSRLSQEDALAERTRAKRVRELSSDFADAIITGDEAAGNRLYEEMKDLDADKAAAYYDTLFMSGGRDQPDVVFNLDLLSSRSELTEMDILNAANAGTLSKKTAAKFLDELTQQDDRDMRDAVQLVKDEFGIPDSGLFTFDEGGKRTEALRQVAAFRTQAIRAVRADPRVDVVALADDFIKEGRVIKALKAQRTDLETSINRAAETLNITDATDDPMALMEASKKYLEDNPQYIDKHMKLMEDIFDFRGINQRLGDQ